MSANLSRTIVLFFAVSLLFVDSTFSQVAKEVIHIKDLPPEGVLLDSGWRFKVGDGPEYANRNYDDSNWESIVPTLDIARSLPQIPEGEICWLRIHLSVDSTVNQLVMVIRQSVASEIYLNERLIHRLGELDIHAGYIKATDPSEKPLSFPFEPDGEQLLAIRLAKQPGISYATHWNTDNPGVRIKLNSVERANANYLSMRKTVDEHDYFRVGTFFILGVLYLAFYMFYPIQRANLFFSIYAILQAIVWGTFIFFKQFNTIDTYPLIKNSLLVVQVASEVIMLSAVYELLKQKKDWIFYGLVAFGLVCIPFGVFVYEWGWRIYGVSFTSIFSIAVTWIVFRSFRDNKFAAIVVAIGGICFMIIWLSFLFGWIPAYRLHLFTIAHLSVPLGVSLYLGYDFARTNRSLQQRLKEVNRLSEEKQHILADQNEVLEKQVSERTSALKRSMDDLKSTQTQLIQSEKMASLGELTAGIAHEIQNPLNFVNNFSEVNAELIDDLKDELASGDNKTAVEIANTIKENQQKINHHGKRADAIVKNMLQHSRSSSGQKELTDINALCEEYLRLTYHGYRAKDKSFNAQLTTDFDSSLLKVNIIRQDIGRVMLNLLNNALYAVHQKSKQNSDGHQPLVTVATKNINGKVEIRIRDNGNGMTAAVKEKIFQPFFTTKPTGEGTGLGLSLAYDIITKTHGGEINVESKEGEGSEFIIRIPV